MSFPFIGSESPKPSRYERFFELDFSALLQHTGAPLLDALIAAPSSEDVLVPIPTVRAIMDANAQTRSDILARIIALTCEMRRRSRDVPAQCRPAYARMRSILPLMINATDLQLASSDAYELLSHDAQLSRAAQLPWNTAIEVMIPGDISEFANEIIHMVLNAKETSVDVRYTELLRATLAEKEERQNRRCLRWPEMALMEAIVTGLGRSPSDFPAIRVYRTGFDEAEAQHAVWMNSVDPLLFALIKTMERIATDQSVDARKDQREVWTRFSDILPEQRGRILADLVALGRHGAELAPSSLWLRRNFLSRSRYPGWQGFLPSQLEFVWRDLIKKPCRFSANEARIVVMYLPDWPTSTAFAKAIARHLVPTAEIKARVEEICTRLDRTASKPAQRTIAKMSEILRESVCDRGTASPSLSDLHREALVAFQREFEESFEKAHEFTKREDNFHEIRPLEFRSLETKEEAVAYLDAVLWLTSSDRQDPALGGIRRRDRLLRRATLVAKFGAFTPEAQQWLATLWNAIDKTTASSGGTNFSVREPQQNRCLERDRLGETRAIIDLFAGVSTFVREQLILLESFAAQARGARPSTAWLSHAEGIAAMTVGCQPLILTLFEQPYFLEQEMRMPFLGQGPDMKKGFVWLCAFWPAVSVIEPLVKLARRCFEPGRVRGLANESVGNACLWTLSALPSEAGLTALAEIDGHVSYSKVHKRVAELIDEAGRRAKRT